MSQWHPTPVLSLEKSHGWRSLVGCGPWGHYESDTTDWLHFHFHFHALEKEMATHSSILAWRIPGMREPGGLSSMESHRVGHDWSDIVAAAAIYSNRDTNIFDYHPILSSVHMDTKGQSERRRNWEIGIDIWASLVAKTIKNSPALQEIRVRSLGREDPMEKGMASHSSILPWKIPWTQKPGRPQSMGLQRVGHNWRTDTSTFIK